MVPKINRIAFMKHKPKGIVEIQFGFDSLQVEIVVEAGKSCCTPNNFKFVATDVIFFGQKSVKCIRDRNIELVLKKKEEDGPYWPHLMKDKKKYHWLKVDFNKWKDEDDSEDDVGQSEDLEEVRFSLSHVLWHILR